MMHATKSAILLVALAMTSACGQPEHPRTVNDFCLIDKRVSVEPAPVAGADDVGNQWDTDQTLAEVLEHNAVHDRVCTG